MEFNKKCWNTLGELSIILESDDTVSLRRCCQLEPFINMSIEDFSNIKDVIAYCETQDFSNPIVKEDLRDRCPKCILPSKIEKVTIGLSKACNLKCYNCFYNSHKDTAEIKKLYFDTLNKIKGHNLKEIRLNDRGEPFFYYYETISFLKQLSRDDTEKISFISNLNTFNTDRIAELKKISNDTNIEYFIDVSIDGITKETYEATRIGGNFEKTVSNLKAFIDSFGVDRICINYTIKKPNFSDTNIKDFFIKTFSTENIHFAYDIYDEEAKLKFYKEERL